MGEQTEPMPLQKWAMSNEPDKKLNYASSYWGQITFVRDQVITLLARDYEEFKRIGATATVIATHTSKSVKLPVFRIVIEDRLEITMRCNFHDWKISIKSKDPVEADFMGLFDPKDKVSSTCCEGFPKDCIYGSYAANKREFTVELVNQYHVYTFFWLFSHQVLNIAKKEGRG
ncbi:MAG: hypothetical protein AAB365_03855 [Patescibacteria group bacterium]